MRIKYNKKEANEFWKSIIYKNGKINEKQVLKELHKYPVPTATAMLEQSILNSWSGVFPIKPNQIAKPVIVTGASGKTLEPVVKPEPRDEEEYAKVAAMIHSTAIKMGVSADKPNR